MSSTSDIKVTTGPQKNNLLNLIIWFVIITVAWYILLYFIIKPMGLQVKDVAGNPTGRVDSAKTLLWSLILAALVVAVVYLIKTWK